MFTFFVLPSIRMSGKIINFEDKKNAKLNNKGKKKQV